MTIRTSGDKGDREILGAFVKEIQQALLADHVDIGLHCLKDLPTTAVPGLRLSAHLEREDSRDALISRRSPLADLATGAKVGTGSVRRTSQLAAMRPDLVFSPLLGNVDTRLQKLMMGEYDAIVLALAGLKRLGILEELATSDYAGLSVHPMSFDQMLPAPGQAVLVLETRCDDARAHQFASTLNHPDTEACALAERSFLKAFGGGCSVPVAASASVNHGKLELQGLVAAPNGSRVLRGSQVGTVAGAVSVAAKLVLQLADEGAFQIFQPTVGRA